MSLAWREKTVEQNALNVEFLCSFCLLFAQLIYHEWGAIQSDWPCRQLHRSDSEHIDMLLPFPTAHICHLLVKSASLTPLLPFFVNVFVDLFSCWWCRSCCPEVTLFESSVLMRCCVRDSTNSYVIQSSSSSSLLVQIDQSLCTSSGDSVLIVPFLNLPVRTIQHQSIPRTT